jgi:hypothetical protein
MSYRKVTMSDIPVWDFVRNSSLEGVYQRKKENVGPNKSSMYFFELTDGSVFAVWGNTVLDGKMASAPIGSQLRITYLGTKKNEKTGRTYKDFEVELWEEEEDIDGGEIEGEPEGPVLP